MFSYGAQFLVQLTVFVVQSSAISRHIKPNHSLIMDGEITSISKVPYQVQLIMPGWSSMWCGGSILTPKLILTAGHCIRNNLTKPASWVKVAIGSSSFHGLTTDPSKQYTVQAGVVHPNYHLDKSKLVAWADFAILFLAKPLNMNQRGYEAQPVSLADRSYAGRIGIVSGFGQMPELPEFLRSAEMPIVTNEECQEAFKKINPKIPIDNSMLCAGSLDDNKDPNNGDSGGPLVVRENGKFVQVGVASWIVSIPKPHEQFSSAAAYTVFANISYARPWIESIIKSSG